MISPRFPVLFAFWLVISAPITATAAESSGSQKTTQIKQEWTVAKICDHIGTSADAWGLPKEFFARLIWTESRFDINALSPVGAQGIAQFMPSTARARGLENPYDPAEALPASASLLAHHRNQFGNLGLAAAAYNAGGNRVRRWLKGNSGMPFETQNYVVTITGKPVEAFKSKSARLVTSPLVKNQPFAKACRALPVLKTRFKGIAATPKQPWGVQVAGNFSQNRAMRSWLRVRPKLGLVTGASKPRLHRVRTLRGLRSKWAVRLGAPNRTAAIRLCKKIRSVGGFCLVKRN